MTEEKLFLILFSNSKPIKRMIENKIQKLNQSHQVAFQQRHKIICVRLNEVLEEFVEVELLFPLKLSQYSNSGVSQFFELLPSDKPQARHLFYTIQNITMEPYEETIQDKLKRDALKRITNYVHPQIKLEHQPINARECSQLQEQMRQLVRQKVEIVRQQYEARSFGRQYQKVYEEFMSMTGRNQAQHQKICRDIRQMHQMADMLLHTPDLNDDKLYLSSSHPSSPAQEQQFNLLMKKYEKMHKQGYELDDYNSQQIIQRAKNYYLRDRS